MYHNHQAPSKPPGGPSSHHHGWPRIKQTFDWENFELPTKSEIWSAMCQIVGVPPQVIKDEYTYVSNVLVAAKHVPDDWRCPCRREPRERLQDPWKSPCQCCCHFEDLHGPGGEWTLARIRAQGVKPGLTVDDLRAMRMAVCVIPTEIPPPRFQRYVGTPERLSKANQLLSPLTGIGATGLGPNLLGLHAGPVASAPATRPGKRIEDILANPDPMVRLQERRGRTGCGGYVFWECQVEGCRAIFHGKFELQVHAGKHLGK